MANPIRANARTVARGCAAALAILLTAAGNPPTVHAQPNASFDARAARVAALLEPWNRPDAPGLAISVTLDGALVLQRAAGSSDLEQGMAITPASVFQAASVSKQFTAYAVLLLEQQGRLSIDDPIARYIPEVMPLGPVTLRQLMTHTGGVRDTDTLMSAAGWRQEDLETNQQALDMTYAQRGLNFPPGSRFQYTNGGYLLLAEVVRRVSGQSFADFCRERIFAPLGMTSTRFEEDLAEAIPGRVQSYDVRGTRYRREILTSTITGPTGLLTTAGDLSRWALSFEPGGGGNHAVQQRMEEQGRLADGTQNYYALGQEFHIYRGLRTWSHGGRDAGFRSFVLRVPGQRFSVTILANRDDVDAAELAYRIADIYLSDHPAYREPPVDTARPTAEDLAAYAGTYELFPSLVFSLRRDGDRLMFKQLGDDDETALPALSRREFELDPRRHLSLVFATPVSGRSPNLAYKVGLNGMLTARRVDLLPMTANEVRPDDYVGRYSSRELGTDYRIVRDGSSLILRHPRFPPTVLRPYQRDAFTLRGEFLGRMDFERSASGQVSGFRLSVPVADDVRFERTPDR